RRSNAASFDTDGSGCPTGAQEPRLDAHATPVLGSPFALDVSAPGLVAASLAVGFSRTIFQGTNLPLELAAVGLPGCWLLVSPDLVLAPQNVSSGSSASFMMQLPNHPSLVGFCLYAQAMVLRPGSVDLSDGARLRLGF
ncbi:MAG: hypothetical protein KDC98_17955, partial [Planctomycetes bacterium]|nr:hypothetical protein [Planctomycetota bacterium]